MTILLTTPFDPCDNDPGQSYPRARLVQLEIYFPGEFMTFTFEFGDVVNGKWVKGVGSLTKRLDVNKSQFQAVMSGENISSKIEQFLISQGLVSGTIE
jgi:hypothetical protein